MPTVSLSAVCAILSGIIATTVESVGDYHACAKLAGSPPPPLHAVNRGMLSFHRLLFCLTDLSPCQTLREVCTCWLGGMLQMCSLLTATSVSTHKILI